MDIRIWREGHPETELLLKTKINRVQETQLCLSALSSTNVEDESPERKRNKGF